MLHVVFFGLFVFKCRCVCVCVCLAMLHAKRCGISVPQPGVEPAPTAVKAGVLTNRLPGKSLDLKLF